MKRRFSGFCAALIFVSASLLGAVALAQYPERPIRMVVPFPPGGISDVVARPIAGLMTAELGRPVAVDNRPGAGGRIGAENVAQAAPDGYTIMLITAGTHGILSAIDPKLRYDAVRDFAPIIRLTETPFVLLVNPALPARNLSEFIEHAKRNPGKISYATAGPGSGHHLVTEMFRRAAGIEIVHIPYKGEAPGLADVVSGQLQMMMATGGKPFVDQGKLRALATTAESRWFLFPDVPTLREQGLEVVYSGWVGLAAPAGTSPEVLDRLNAAARKALANDELAKRFKNLGYSLVDGAREALGERIKADVAKWIKFVADHKLVFEQ
jgi:tripartite-type tricarboxylate transporter receptor subunit TctC